MAGNEPHPLDEVLQQPTLGAALAQGHYDPDAGYCTVMIGIRIDEAHLTGERDLYCPAAVPCLGRPGLGIAVPVRRSDTGGQVGEVRGVYCPVCRTTRADERR